MGLRSVFLGLVDRMTCSRHTYSIGRLCSRFWKQIGAAEISLLLVIGAAIALVVFWPWRVQKVDQSSPVHIRPMVTPDQMRGVLQQGSNRRAR